MTSSSHTHGYNTGPMECNSLVSGLNDLLFLRTVISMIKLWQLYCIYCLLSASQGHHAPKYKWQWLLWYGSNCHWTARSVSAKMQEETNNLCTADNQWHPALLLPTSMWIDWTNRVEGLEQDDSLVVLRFKPPPLSHHYPLITACSGLDKHREWSS